MKISTRIKVLLFSFFVFCMLGVSAQVVITRPSGGQDISNNLSLGSTLAAYKPIGDIVIQETAPGDFAANPNLRVLTIARPNVNWQLQTSGVTVEVVSPNNELINVSVLESTVRVIKIQYRVPNPTTGNNKIIVKGIALQSLNRVVSSAQNGNVYVYKDPVDEGRRGVINGITAGAANETSTTKLAPVTKVRGSVYQLIALMPGQALNSGDNATGKNTETIAQTPTAGDLVNVKVYATDYGWYPVASSAAVSFTSNDNYALFPGGPNNLNGTLTGTDFSVQLRTATALTDRTITVADDANLIAPNTTSATAVNVGVFTKLLAVFPGETYAPGSTNGKTGTVLAPQAGAPYVSTVYGVDEFWNKATVPNPTNVQFNVTNVTNFTPVLAANLSNSGVTASSQTFDLVFNTAGEIPNVTAVNNTDATKTSYNQILPAVTSNLFTKLQILLPGEVAAPGTATGKTGSPTVREAGVPFNVTVNAVDDNWNLVTNVTDVIAISPDVTSDATTSLLPANAALTGGAGTFSVTLRRAALDHQLVATNVTDTGKDPVTSANVAVAPGAFTKFLITLTGEDYLPGTTSGKGNALATISVDETTVPTVRAVDAFWNTVTTETGIAVVLSSSDLNAVIPSSQNIDAAGSAVFSDFQFKTPGNRTITATSDADPTKNYTTSAINVTAGAFAKLVLVMPGETAVEGIPAGKSGSANPQVAGQSFPVFIKAIDAGGNTVTTANNLVTFNGDSYAQLPPNTSLANGILNATATYRVAGANKLLEVRDVVNAISGNVQFDVNVGPYAGLLITFPNGQTYVPGSPTGNIDPIPNQGINTSFDIVVRAVDAAYNLIASVNGEVTITSNDVTGVMPPNGTLVNGVSGNLSVSLNSISTSTTITSTSVADVTKNYTTGAITVLSPSASNDYFRSARITGIWTNSSSWESSATGNIGSWQASTRVPGTAAKGITVRNGHTITINASISLDDVLVENGAQVNLIGGNLTVADNTAVVEDFLVQGIFRQSGGTILGDGTFQIASGGKYQHNYNSATTIPTLNWAVGSTCEIIGYTTYAGDVTGSSQTFSNFVWNASNQTAAGSPSLLSGFSARDFTVTSTGAGSLNLGSVGGTITITRDYTQAAGTVSANKTSGTQNLSFGRDFSVNGGNFTLGNGTVNLAFNGSNQDLTNSGSAIEFQNVTFSNGGTKTLVSGSFSLATTGVLTMAANSTLEANGNLTVLSDASSSGTVAAIPSTSQIIGNVTVERYITGGSIEHRTYRMFSSPIYDNSTPTNRRYSFLQFDDDMIISGGPGFYPTPNNTASAWTYDVSLGGDPYQPIPNLSTSVPVGEGAYLFYRGDKINNLTNKVTPPYAIPESFPMTFTGMLNQQDVSVSLKTGFNLVGNPYASSIDWNSLSITKTNLRNNTVRIWDPVSRSYASYNGDTGVPSGMNNIIPAGQGFFVQSDAGGTLIFTEAAKIGAQPSSFLMSAPTGDNLTLQKVSSRDAAVMAAPTAQSSAAPRTELRLALKRSDLSYNVETAVVFEQGRNANYQFTDDVNYVTADGEYGTQVFFSSSSADNRKLAINYLPEVSNTSKVRLDLDNKNAAGDYSLKINLKNVPSGYLVRLNDSFLNMSKIVSDGDVHPFSIINGNGTSAGADRFSVIFEAPVTLPVTYNTQFTVAKTNQGVLTKWSTATEVNNNRFEVRRAGDDKVYQKLHTELAKGVASAYSFVDKNPLLGNNYYKLVQFDNDGTFTETLPQVINYTGSINSNLELVSVFPNPIVSNFTVKFNGDLKANQQTLKIVNATGKVLLTQNVSKPQLTTGHEINISGYPSGIYFVEVYENGAQRLGQMKLIKQ